MRSDARINEKLTAVTDETPPGGSPTERLHLLVSIVDCLRGGSPSKPPGVRLYFLCCLGYFSYYFCLPFLLVSFFYFYGLAYYVVMLGLLVYMYSLFCP